MPIDVHAHLLPRSAVRAQAEGSDWFGSRVWVDPEGRPVVETGGVAQRMGSPWHYDDPESRVERMDRLGLDRQVVSLLPPLFRYGLPPEEARAAARSVNDELAGMVRDRPERFGGLGTLPLQDPDATLKELERLVRDLGLAGVAVGTHVGGRHWDHPDLEPVLEAIADLGCVMLLHPMEVRVKSWMPTGAHLGNVLGNPFESTVAFASLVFGGLLDRFPRLQPVFVHGGGYIPYGVGRMQHAWEERPDVRARCAQPPQSYLRRVYFDSLTHDDRALRYLIDRAGADRIVLGTDYPADMGQLDAVERIGRNAFVSGDELAAIFDGNALRLLGLDRGAGVS